MTTKTVSGYRIEPAAGLAYADLAYADLRGADLRDANLTGADLRDADLRGANLTGADLRDADLRGANLTDADLTDADLRGADLRDANLLDADLAYADLRGADLRGAVGLVVTFSFGRHTAIAAGGYVSIGCLRLPYDNWLRDYVVIGTDAGYSPKEIVVYGQAITLAINWLRFNQDKKE